MSKRKRKGRESVQDADTSAYKREYSKFIYEDGRPVPWKDFPSDNSSATWARQLYEPMFRETKVLQKGISGRERLVPGKEPSIERSLIPYLVTFGVFYSEQATDAHKTYGIIYAPNGDAPLATTALIKFWRCWVKNPMLIQQGMSIESTISTYPLLSKVSSAEVIDDKEYNQIWQSVKKSGRFKAAGHPLDPHTVLIEDPTFDPYRGGDSFSGMQGITEY